MTSRLRCRRWVSVLRRHAAVSLLAAVLLPAFVAVPSARAQTFTVVYAFTGAADGAEPMGNLITDDSGTLYGTTTSGGGYGWGTVFKVDTTGKETVLYSFTDGDDGGEPQAGLVRDVEGSLYGTTWKGGSGGGGTVFKVDASGAFSVVYTFTTYQIPQGGLVLDTSGNLYGTTEWGGTDGVGTVFEVSKTGHERILHSFRRTLPDGAWPNGNLVMDKAGNLFGTTFTGGAGACFYGQGCGTVFKLSRTGQETIVYRFLDLPDGAFPFAGVVSDSTGNLYSTTAAGGHRGCNIYGPGCGTVFRVNLRGREDVLHRLLEKKLEGLPEGGLVRDSKGNLYGTALYDYGTVFKIDKRGKETVLHHLFGGDGTWPTGSLVFDRAGNLYGTTEFGGAYGYGVVFKVTP
jgi:uncharacterized repeat protein (TIGR03803 family)